MLSFNVCKYCHSALPKTAVYCCTCGRKQITAATLPKHRRRGKAEGTITVLAGRKKPYWARLPAEYDSDKVVRKSLGCFRTRAEAAKALGEAMYAPESRSQEPLTLTDVYDRFTSSHYFNALSASAQGSHRTAWKHLTACSSIPINTINKETFQRPIDDLHRKGLKRETLAKVRNLSSLLCKEAMGLGLITVNYGQLVQLPKSDSKGVPPFTVSELKKLWASADLGDKRAMTVLMMCYTGMRPGELLAIRIERHLRTFQSYKYIQIGSKTDAGRNRIIPIPALLLPILTALIDGRNSGPLIAAQKGGHYRPDNWRPRCFNVLMAELKIKDRVPYSCRHTYADLQKRRKIAPELMMEIMGHEDYATTVEHYQTTTDEDLASICSAVDGLTRPE